MGNAWVHTSASGPTSQGPHILRGSDWHTMMLMGLESPKNMGKTMSSPDLIGIDCPAEAHQGPALMTQYFLGHSHGRNVVLAAESVGSAPFGVPYAGVFMISSEGG